MRSAWLLVPVLGSAELLAHLHFSHVAPEPDAWRPLAPHVERLRQHDELVVVAPQWAEPNARYALGDRLMPLRDVARPDESAYARAIEVSALGKRAPELIGWTEVSAARVGPFELRVLENPKPARVTFNFVDGLTPERASAFTGEHREPCRFNPRARVSNGKLEGHATFPRERFQCPGGDWHFIGVTAIEDRDYRPRRCIWAHPRRGPLVARFQGVPLGNVIAGYGALPWYHERESHGTPVVLEVRVDGTSLGTFTHEDGESWKRFEWPLGEQAGRVADVEFLVSSSRTSHREFCFQADSR